MFRVKRKEHHHIVQTLGQMQTDVKRYKAVQLLLDQIFKVNLNNQNLLEFQLFIQVLNESRVALTSASFVPSVSPFPTEEKTRDRMFYIHIKSKTIVISFRIIIVTRKCFISR